jgi:hypothetical protein
MLTMGGFQPLAHRRRGAQRVGGEARAGWHRSIKGIVDKDVNEGGVEVGRTLERVWKRVATLGRGWKGEHRGDNPRMGKWIRMADNGPGRCTNAHTGVPWPQCLEVEELAQSTFQKCRPLVQTS